MDFKLSEQQQELQQTARNFAQKEMTEVAHSIEQTSEPLSKEWLKKICRYGVFRYKCFRELRGIGFIQS
jgi:alkylation response protein AidB-like acyl-CoA dehydrogenase